MDPETGEELKDPPFEIGEVFCRACEMLADHDDDKPKGERRKGTHPYFRRLD